jgi:hypothetical protein
MAAKTKIFEKYLSSKCVIFVKTGSVHFSWTMQVQCLRTVHGSH